MELVGGIPEVLCGCGGRWLLQKKMFASVMDFNLSLGASKAKPVLNAVRMNSCCAHVNCSSDSVRNSSRDFSGKSVMNAFGNFSEKSFMTNCIAFSKKVLVSFKFFFNASIDKSRN